MEIVLENFTKRFGDLTVIENMNLKIKEGEMLALLGPSGCGKSTTLFAICGIHRVDEGRVLFGGQDVTRVPAQQRNIGVVFQSYALYPHMTVAQNIAFPLTVRHEDKQTIKKKVGEMAELVHIEELLGRRPEQLSGGQQQRVALARALIRKPGALLLDGPLAELDFQAGEIVCNLLGDLPQTTVVIASPTPLPGVLGEVAYSLCIRGIRSR